MTLMRRLLSLFLVLLVAVSLSARPVYAAGGMVQVDGKLLLMDKGFLETDHGLFVPVGPVVKALGGTVGPNPVKEIGWGGVSKVGFNAAPEWLGELPSSFEVFQWHGETFSIPAGAERLLESPFCANQAFLLDNRHLGLQCHIEMTVPMIKAWCEVGAEEIAQARHPGPRRFRCRAEGLTCGTGNAGQARPLASPRISRMDHGCETGRHPRAAHCPGGRVACRRQAAQLEIRKPLRVS